ncbi:MULTISPECIES: proliferating cell nuclear antigen (pcna) [Metallosphaera]|uniref:DNA polymerase sliding clamp n=3 Tax=Metallosphaera TaxID=41980 RepID=A4YIY6_METS5|nr:MULTISPECIES: proliferating cell nuclear antigen (pcna) [Metallosphaera]ABP96388.1 DNA polymerase sliding clamp subunit A [Metallosphaera sedula DSM 5348]AIM28371.1 DNA polymerase sliding clamp subunit A [Metallosphaera sedula]AKV75164.1 DNA polymerase [Metallosphaera sedula]AKV77400.1 DNA polymerase [Metallosphaera sedula]AKV79652.1 DNA polymerase [Metallosphaera sedula]
MRIAYANAMDFKTVIEALSKLIDEVTFTFTSSGLDVVAVDRAHISLIKLHFPKEAFEEFDVEDQFRFGFNTQYMLKVMASAKRKEKIEMESREESEIVIRMLGEPPREFTIRNIEVPIQELPELKLDFDVKAKITSGGFKKAVSEIATVSDSVEIDATEMEIKLRSKESTEIEVEFSKEMGGLQEIEVKKPSVSSYPSDYLEDVLVLTRLSGFLNLLFSEQKPLQLEFNMDNGGSVVYLLAPNVG